MKINMGKTDRSIRIFVAVVIAVLIFTDVLTGTLATVGLVAAALLLITGMVKVCPLYLPFGASTCTKPENSDSGN